MSALPAPVWTHTARATPPTADASGALAYRPGTEVRLRKLHLVRPDLIPYPLCYEIYC